MSPHSGPVLQDPLVAQRNPFEVFLLAFGVFVGLATLLGRETSRAIDQSLDPITITGWAGTLTVGCLVGLIGTWMPIRWIELGLHLERFGVTLTAAGTAVYSYLVWQTQGGEGLYAAGVNLAFSLACIARVRQITRRFRWRELNHWKRPTGRPSE